MSLLGRFLCWFDGRHLRGILKSAENGVRVTECPRCGRITKRKVKS